MLEKKHGKKALTEHAGINEHVQEKIQAYDDSMLEGENSTIYNFGVGVIEGEELEITADGISIPGQKNGVSLDVDNPYQDFF